jgi:hypothetical protein
MLDDRRPMVWRVLAYSSASSRQRCINPTPSAAISGRTVEHLHGDEEARTLPSISARRHLHVVEKYSAAGPALTQFAQRLAHRKPGVARSMKKALMPRCPASGRSGEMTNMPGSGAWRSTWLHSARAVPLFHRACLDAGHVGTRALVRGAEFAA